MTPFLRAAMARREAERDELLAATRGVELPIIRPVFHVKKQRRSHAKTTTEPRPKTFVCPGCRKTKRQNETGALKTFCNRSCRYKATQSTDQELEERNRAERMAAILRCHARGLSAALIAEQLGGHFTHISEVIRRAGFTPHRDRRSA